MADASPVLFWSGRRADRVQVVIAGLLAFLLLGSMVALSVIGTGGGTSLPDGGADRAAPLVRDIDGRTVVALAVAGQGEQTEGEGGQGAASGGSAAAGLSPGFTPSVGGGQFPSGVALGSVGFVDAAGDTGGAGQGQGQGGEVDQGGGQDDGGTGGDGGVVGGGDAQIDGEPPAVEALGSETTKPPKVKPPKVKPVKTKPTKPEEHGKPDKGDADVSGAGEGAGHSMGHGRGHEIGAGHGHDKHH